jgi:hypothetical protein
MKGDYVDPYDEISSAQDCRWHRQLKAHSATYAYMGETCALRKLRKSKDLHSYEEGLDKLQSIELKSNSLW